MIFFSKLGKCVSGLFCSKKEESEQKPPAKQSSGKTASRASAPKKPARTRNNRQTLQASGRKSPAKPAASVRPAVKTVPVKPEKLREIPAAEGKVRFLDMALHTDLQFALQDMDFEYCTPIQEQSLPLLLQGMDVAGKAQTGTGKTAAFLLALFQKILNTPAAAERKNGSCRAVILAPTRELAIQIHKDAEAIAKYTGLHNVVVFGGMDYDKQKAELDTPVDLLIGTPGRVIDYAQRGLLKLGSTEFLVLDEADRMLDMGFIPDVRRIVGMMPGKDFRQTLLFSATLSEEIMRLAANFQKTNTVTVASEPDSVVGENIEQTFYTVAVSEKLPMLCYTINNEVFDRMLIFGNRKDHNLQMQYELQKRGIECELLSGDIPQQKRLNILERFRSGSTRILIATDVAARGIHVDDVNIVVNYDLPEQAEDYVHRIGRTGRAGSKGKSISFVCEYGAYSMPAIEKLLDCEFKSILPEDDMLIPPPVHPGAVTAAKNPKQRSPRYNRNRSGNSRRSNSGRRQI